MKLRKNLVVQNIAMVGSIAFIVKLVSFFKETVVAAHFGLNEVLDTFFIAILVPSFISNVFLGAFKNVFIPNYVAEMKSENGKEGSFQTMAILTTLVISIFFTAIAFLVTDVYVEFLFPGHTAEYYALIESQFQYLLPCIILWGLSSLLGGLLYIDNEFRLSSFAGIFTPLIVILLLLVYPDVFGSDVLAIGTLLGSIANLGFLTILCKRRGLIKIDRPNFRNPNAIMMIKQVPAKVSSGLATGMNKVVDQFFAAQLAIGSIAAINYGLKIPAFLSGLLVIAITNVLLPHFSKSILEDRAKTFRNLFRILRTVFIGTAIVSFVGVLLSEPVVRLIFERREFTSENTALVAVIQQAFLIYLPFTITGMVMVNFLTSINRNAIMAYISIGALILNTILDYILMQFYGVLGIAFTTTIVVIMKNLVMFWYLYRLQKSEITQA